MLLKFIIPYVMACYSAAYALLQTLDGLGLVSTNYVELDSFGQMVGSYWSPNKLAQMFGGGLFGLFLLLLPMLMLCSWILVGKRGLIICLLILISPGLGSVLGLLPHIQWLPDRYDIQGTGSVGDATGMLCLVFGGLICGWIIGVLISDLFSTGEKFRQWSDIILILTAVTSGVFWVSDKEVAVAKKEYVETVNDVNHAAQYLLMQVRDYSNMCVQTNNVQKLSCYWASFVQEKLNEIASISPSKAEMSLPDNLQTFYFMYTQRDKIGAMEVIRNELSEYNNELCPVKILSDGVSAFPAPSGHCQTPPFSFCNAQQEGKFSTNPLDKTAIANECILASILRYRVILEKTGKLISENAREQHFRWFWFIALSALLGVKIANVMTKMFNVESRPASERHKIWKLIGLVMRLLCRTVTTVITIGRVVCTTVVYQCRRYRKI